MSVSKMCVIHMHNALILRVVSTVHVTVDLMELDYNVPLVSTSSNKIYKKNRITFLDKNHLKMYILNQVCWHVHRIFT